jgi:hypothetical protein
MGFTPDIPLNSPVLVGELHPNYNRGFYFVLGVNPDIIPDIFWRRFRYN